MIPVVVMTTTKRTMVVGFPFRLSEARFIQVCIEVQLNHYFRMTRRFSAVGVHACDIISVDEPTTAHCCCERPRTTR
jgi:hypothetical protein